MQANSKRFTFDGGALTYVGTGLLALLLTIFSLGGLFIYYYAI
jgi:hypothetical protein